MITKFAVSRGKALATVLLCGLIAMPAVAVAAERALGADPAAACAALSGAGSGAIKVDTAALTEAEAADRRAGRTDARRPHQSRDPAILPRARSYRSDRSEGAADPLSAQSAAAVERPHGAVWRRRLQRHVDHRPQPAAGGALRQRLAAGAGICDLRHRLRSRDQTGRTAAAVCRQRRGLRQFCACLLQESARRCRHADGAGLRRQARADVFRRQFGGRARGPDHGAALPR